MKIAYITMQFPVPSETFLSNDVDSIVSVGHHVRVYGMRPKHKNHDTLINERNHRLIDVRNFSSTVLVDALAMLVRRPMVAVSLIVWLLKTCYRSPIHLCKSLVLVPSAIGHCSDIIRYAPDIVHLFWGHYPSMIGHLVKKYDANIIVTQFLGAHDLVAKYPGSREFSKVSDKVFTHSNANKPLLRDFGIDIDHVRVIHRGTQTGFRYSNLNKFESLQSPVFLTASRLIKEKGVDEVIDVFASAQSLIPAATLLIAGEGPGERRLKSKVYNLGLQHKIKFLGHVSHSRLLKVMGSSHFFLLLSNYPAERLPNVVKEAMLQQCIVVTTRTVGIDEMVEHAKNGFVVEPNELNSVISYINHCVSNPLQAKCIAEIASETVIQRFDVKHSMKSYIDEWKRLIDLRNSDFQYGNERNE